MLTEEDAKVVEDLLNVIKEVMMYQYEESCVVDGLLPRETLVATARLIGQEKEWEWNKEWDDKPYGQS